jgi:hypothetical protein
MMKLVMLIAVSLVSYAASAQVVVHDYVWISAIGSSIYIASTLSDEQIIVPPKEERRGVTGMQTASMKIVQEHEANGWELYSFDAYQRETESTARMIWIMRKPKE